MKETIEWHYTVEEATPFNGADVLMVINGGPGEIRGVVAGEFYKSAGFVLPCGEPVQPSMWCYFPKGQQ
jgi:hypothetical protein